MTKNDLISAIAEKGGYSKKEAEQALAAVHKDIKVAVMGCAVNGPGEAADADIGIAGGNGEFLFFAKGKPLYKVSPEQVINTLLDEVEKL